MSDIKLDFTGSFITLGFILAGLISWACTMAVVAGDARRRGINAWIWTTLIFLVPPLIVLYLIVRPRLPG
jgi:hypothetical protein